MADLIPKAITKAGFDIIGELVAADVAGDIFDATGSNLFIAVQNTDAAAKTITIAAPVTEANCGNYGELAVEDMVFVIAQDELETFSIPAGYAVDGKFNISYSAVTGVLVGGFSIA